jgi:hypothetical protein
VPYRSGFHLPTNSGILPRHSGIDCLKDVVLRDSRGLSARRVGYKYKNNKNIEIQNLLTLFWCSWVLVVQPVQEALSAFFLVLPVGDLIEQPVLDSFCTVYASAHERKRRTFNLECKNIKLIKTIR